MQTSYLLRKHNSSFHLYPVIQTPYIPRVSTSSVCINTSRLLRLNLSLRVLWICVNKQGIDLTSAGRRKLLAPNERAPYYKSAGTPFVAHFVVLALIRVNRREIFGTWELSGSTDFSKFWAFSFVKCKL